MVAPLDIAVVALGRISNKIGRMKPTAVEIEKYMRLAIDVCRRGIAGGQSPFGAVVVAPDSRVVAAHNRVWETTDITAHAEITLLRKAGAEWNTIDFSGCWLFSTTEPCPMCAAACHWARLECVVYGASIADAARGGFNELPIPAATMLAASPTQQIGGVLSQECAALFDEWRQRGMAREY